MITRVNLIKGIVLYGKKLENVKEKIVNSLVKEIRKSIVSGIFTHNDIEIYGKTIRHLGSMEPVTRELYKPSVPGRTIVRE